VKIIDNRVQVSGQVAVMSINERLLQTLMQKNPDVPFAMEESSSLSSTYVGAAPLGPLLELRAGEASGAFTAAEAAQSLDAWRMAAQRLRSSPDTQSDAPKAYAQMAVAQGNLFAHHGLAGEAEEAWRLAAQMAPSHLAPVERLSQFLVEGGRGAEAQRLLEEFARSNPGRGADVDKLRTRLSAP
jgi:predicted Zn-dependent protease